MTAELQPISLTGEPNPEITEEDALKLEGLGTDDLELLVQAPDFNQGEADDFSNVEEPHLLFDTAVLFDRIRALAVVVKDKQELVSKVVSVRPMGSYVLFAVNTGEVQAEVRVDVTNTQRPLTDSFRVDFKAFYSVVRNSGQKFLIRKRNDNPIVTVLGGEIEFENYNFDQALFDAPAFGNPDNTTVQKIEGGLFHRFLTRAFASMALANRPEDRRVRVEDGTAFSNFLSSVFIQREVAIQNISFRAIDLLFLKTVLDGVPEFNYFTTAKESVFTTTWMRVAIPKIDTVDISIIKDAVATLERVQKFTISPTHLYRVVSLIRNMVGNSGVVKLSPSESQLWVSANTKGGRGLKFPIAAAPPELEFNISCSIQSLVSTTMLLKKEAIVSAAIDKAGRMIIDGDMVEIVFGTL